MSSTGSSNTSAGGAAGGASAANAAGRAGAWWRRLLYAQESGLVLVIVLLGAVLTIWGGTKSGEMIQLGLPEAAVVGVADGVVTITNAGAAVEARVADVLAAAEDGNLALVTTAGTVRYQSMKMPRYAEADRRVSVWPLENRFLNLTNLVQIATFASFIAVMAVGMTGVIVSGGIDLSVGSVYAVAALAGALVLHRMEVGAGDGSVPTALAVVAGLGACCGVGALCGALNGAMIVGLRVHPFIITLGMMAVLRGVAAVSTRGQSISGLPEGFQQSFFKVDVAGVQPMLMLIMLGVMLLGMLTLTSTVFGRRVFAIGGNEVAARYAGIPVGRVKIIVYTLMGLLAGLSGCMYLGYFAAAEANAGNGYELSVIAAAVIGGASLAGGKGTALGAVLGAILVQLLQNAMLIFEIDTNYNQIIMGAAIVVAVVLDQLKTRLTGSAGR